MQVVLRTFLQIPNASIGKPTLISIAIISLAAIVVLVAVSFKNQLAEEELIGALPTWPPAGPIEVQPMRPLSASTAAVSPGDAETAMQSSGTSRKLVPLPRPRPVHKPRPRQTHNIRNDADITDAVAILKDLRDPSQIDRAVKDNPSNVFLLLMAEIRRASHETGRLIEKLIDEIEPPTLPKELNYARASRAQLEAYRVDLEA